MVERTLSLSRQEKKITKRCLRIFSHAPTTGTKIQWTFWPRRALSHFLNVWARKKRIEVAVRYQSNLVHYTNNRPVA